MPRSLPPQEYLQQCFAYNPDLGMLLWRSRPREHFLDKPHWRTWLTRYASRPAGYRDKDGYSHVRILNRRYPAHRIIYKLMTNEEPPEIDHKDGNPFNNRWNNLRAATRLQNSWNVRRNIRILPRGVRRSRARHAVRYEALSMHNKKYIHLGTFDTPEEAHAAFCAYADKTGGDFFNKM